MKPLLKVILVLTLVFATTFLIIRFSGVLTEDDIKIWLKAATNINPVYVVSVVVLLLVVDILIAVPTLTICLLSGYFLGFQLGGLSALILDEPSIRRKNFKNHHFFQNKKRGGKSYF